MRFLPSVPLSLVVWFLASIGYARETLPIVDRVEGWIFDQTKGVLEKNDVFADGFVPFNQMAAGILAVITLDLGRECRMEVLGDEQARAVAQGKRPPPDRPARCDSPRGTLKVTVQQRGVASKKEIRLLSLEQFFAGEDGKVRVPVFLYRSKDKCTPLSLKVNLVGYSTSLSKLAQFACGE